MPSLPALLLLPFLALGALPAGAQVSIGLAMGNIDTFQARLVEGVETAAAEAGASVSVSNAELSSETLLEQVGRQLDSGIDVLIVVLTDSDTGPRVTELAQARGTPVVFANSEPANLRDLPSSQVYVGSDERVSGTLQAQEVCRLLGGKGRVGLMTGELTHPAARQRTVDVHEVVAGADCAGLELVEQQSALWSRDYGAEVMREWLAAGITLDAVIANNDEMALGAILALQEAQVHPDDIVVAGVDATAPALEAMRAGTLDVTVLQNALVLGTTSVAMARRLAAGEEVEQVSYVPFELVTPANIDRYDPR
ncbi:substrate-binding domain-containing protein [Oceanicella sp. SM1341]|uniref:substrate-binding domain-containing protein n=1 Tax=Oceanicella sp. SM1341 TaxID=1548889 RepID=UPI0013004055|nr:substrate-binding domain-containing protein [Oceanicella sp. SM1341]